MIERASLFDFKTLYYCSIKCIAIMRERILELCICTVCRNALREELRRLIRTFLTRASTSLSFDFMLLDKDARFLLGLYIYIVKID